MTDGAGLPPVTLVLGGARSGKSAYAERLMAAAGAPRIYLATADPGAADSEMAQRIAQHRARRGRSWHTVEAQHDLPDALTAAGASGNPVLLDSVTLWLSNRLLAEADLGAEGDALAAALDTLPGPAVVVSDEVGLSVVPENALARRFRDRLGSLNQTIAARADAVVLVAAGLPLTLKYPRQGALP